MWVWKVDELRVQRGVWENELSRAELSLSSAEMDSTFNSVRLSSVDGERRTSVTHVHARAEHEPYGIFLKFNFSTQGTSHMDSEWVEKMKFKKIPYGSCPD